ncbi:peptidase C14 caspase catalytic subunit p20 [Cylindrospermum sp. NIES-4074]|nr:peptidase C14 caspase catalytic subunit p20 [Cylindrospermum sp. NIES-4074]
MKRRTFLQRIGSILAVLGVTEAEWLTLGNRYYQALAQPSPRKLALLVGINQYSQSPALGGCLTDVELQKELLIHRFGFLPSDILTLTEEQASREFIEAAFWNHLGKQAKPDDLVVFHFSGYGSRVKLGTSPDTVQNAFVPADGQDAKNKQFVNYLLEETLLLLLRSLPTDRVTAVLDSSYYAPSTFQPAWLRIRALPELPEAKLATGEVEFLTQLKTQNLKLNNAVVLTATSEPQQLARELLLPGLSAGFFTYALTQYLWEATPATTTQVIFSHVGGTMYKLGSKQQPALLSEQKNLPAKLIVDNLLLNDTGGEGVVTAIDEDGKTVQLWLAGLPPQVLAYYGANSRLTVVTGEQLVLRSRTGLTAKANIANPENSPPPQVGQLVQEAVRVLPRNIPLYVALDTGLERIEKVDATSAFAAFVGVYSVATTEQPADYVFGKLQETPSRYGLFTVGGELIPNSAGEAGEAVKVGVQRLTPKFETLLATKLWRLTENAGSSRLAFKASLEIINSISSRLVMERETVRLPFAPTLTSKSSSTPLEPIPKVPVGSRLQYRVQNLSDRPLYLMLVGLNNNRAAIAFYPWQIPQVPSTSETKPHLEEVVISPTETLIFPQTAAATGWTISTPVLFCEYQLIVSTAPFSKTLAALASAKYPTADLQPISTLVNPLEVVQALLQDLHDASAVKVEKNGTASDFYIWDVNNWASLSFSFQVE